MVTQVDSLDLEIRNHVSSCTVDARQMKDESEKKEHEMSTVEKDADDFLKVLPCVVLCFILFYSVSVPHGQTESLTLL
jgi:hypothetical protein